MEFLRLSIDPLLAEVGVDFSVPQNPVLATIHVNTEAIAFEQAEAGQLTVWRPKSAPVITIGDVWTYASGSTNIGKGTIYFKKLAGTMEITEDELNAMKTNPVIGVIKKSLTNHQKDVALSLQEEFASIAIRGLNYTGAGKTMDERIKGLFQISSTGDLGDPKSLDNGTIKDLSAVILSGNQQTENNVTTIMATIAPLLVKIDAISNRQMPLGNRKIGIDPISWEIMNSSRDILNSANSKYSERTYLQDFAQRGVTFVKSPFWDTTYAYASNDPADMCLYIDSETDFTMHIVPPADGGGWDPDWIQMINDIGGEKTLSYMKRKRLQVGYEPKAWGIRNAAGAYTFYKKVYWFKVIPFKNT
jgi:hypothetical protein